MKRIDVLYKLRITIVAAKNHIDIIHYKFLFLLSNRFSSSSFFIFLVQHFHQNSVSFFLLNFFLFWKFFVCDFNGWIRLFLSQLITQNISGYKYITKDKKTRPNLVYSEISGMGSFSPLGSGLLNILILPTKKFQSMIK